MTRTPTPEQIEQIPAVYRDYMLILKQVPDTRSHVLQIGAIPSHHVFNALGPKYGYSPEEIRALTQNLKSANLIEEDQFGFVKPTTKGENLIEAIFGGSKYRPVSVPSLPDFI